MHCIFSGKIVLLIKLHINFSSSFNHGIHIHLAEGLLFQNFENVHITVSKKGLTDRYKAWKKVRRNSSVHLGYLRCCLFDL